MSITIIIIIKKATLAMRLFCRQNTTEMHVFSHSVYDHAATVSSYLPIATLNCLEFTFLRGNRNWQGGTSFGFQNWSGQTDFGGGPIFCYSPLTFILNEDEDQSTEYMYWSVTPLIPFQLLISVILTSRDIESCITFLLSIENLC